MIKRLKRLRDLFYAGPRFLGVAPPRRNGYQSPTLTAALWIYALIMRHLTLAGRMLIICSGLIMLYAMFSLLMPVHLLAFAILVLFAFDLAVGFALRPRLRVHRESPARLQTGAEQLVHYRIENRSRLPAWDISLDSLPFPGELRFTPARAFAAMLAPGERLETSARLTAGRRGRYTLPAVRADSAFPFGLWRWGVTAGAGQSLVVHPAFTPLQSFALPGTLRYQAGGIALSSHVGESMEFLGCREFRDGDDPRRLHWRSWARTSRPVVKEFREEFFCRTALIADTFRPRRRWPRVVPRSHAPEDAVLEAGISLVAAIADHLAALDTVVDLFAAGPEVYRFQGGRSLGYLENILDILACLQAHHGEPCAMFTAELMEDIARISSAVFVLLAWNPARRRLIEDVTAAGVETRVFLVTESDAMPADLPATVTVLSAAAIRAGRCTAL